MTDPALPPAPLRSRVRRGLALATLGLAAAPIALAAIGLAVLVGGDAFLALQSIVMLGSGDTSGVGAAVVCLFIVVILGVQLAAALPIWIGSAAIVGGLAVDVRGERSASASTLLLCAACNVVAAGALALAHAMLVDQSIPGEGALVPLALANGVGGALSVVVAGIAYARGTSEG